MDIDLLSKMVAELILDNDEVALPGVGSFIAEFVPSSFSDKGYTINPPYRRLSFRQRESSDTKLIDFYADKNHLDTITATSILTKFLLEMREILKVKKTIVFPGLGRLRATRENNFFFIPDEDLNIYPEGFGLAPVSLKTHVETDDEVQTAVENLQSIIAPAAAPVVESAAAPALDSGDGTSISTPLAPENAPGSDENGDFVAKMPENAPSSDKTVDFVAEQSESGPEPESEPIAEAEPEPAPSSAETKPEPAAEPEPTAEPVPSVESAKGPEQVAAPEPTPAPKPEPTNLEGPVRATDKVQKRSIPAGWKAVIYAAAAIIIIFVLFFIVSRLAPDFIDKLLYNKEELEIIRTFQL
ncbi:MAG: hypothetical protein Q4G10_06755 [Bacteroidia bacterium]|nr:hypothetical protein [Bacteroidia bacterium]